MNAKRRNMAIYAGKLMSAVLLCYLLSLWVSRLDYIWALISAVLVMSPEGKDAQDLSITRIKGNILGCLVGVLFLFAALENPVNIIAGAFVSLMLCYAFKLVAGARSLLIGKLGAARGRSSGGAITKGYAKVRSTEPKLQHPANPDLLRQFSPAEHARMKGIPEHLVFGLSATVAHELLGQAVCYAPFLAVGKAIGRALGELLHQHRCSQRTSGPATEDRRAARHAAQKCGEPLLGVLGVGTAVQRQ